MTDTSKRELIEEARRAIHAAIPGSGDYEDWIEAIPRGLDLLGDVARAALSVFEQAHTPTEAEVVAALDAFVSAHDEMGESLHDSMRAALRAAYETKGEGR